MNVSRRLDSIERRLEALEGLEDRITERLLKALKLPLENGTEAASTRPRVPAEIQRAIIESVADENGTLFKLMFVCKDWATAATDVLWRKPILRHFKALPQSRKQHYANKFKTLSIFSDEAHDWLRETGGLSFPRLKELKVRNSALDEITSNSDDDEMFFLTPPYSKMQMARHFEPCIHRFAQSSLTIFEYCGGPPSVETMALISANCRGLKVFVMEDTPKALTVDKSLAIFGPLGNLKELDIDAGTNSHVYGDKFFSLLSQRSSLQILRINFLMDSTTLQRLAFRSGTSFPNMKELLLRTHSLDVRYIPQIMKNLTELELYLVDTPRGVFETLRDMTKLRKLWITFCTESSIWPVNLTGLKNLKDLESLQFNDNTRDGIVTGKALVDKHLIELAAALPKLHGITLQIQHARFSHQSLEELGQSCRKLEWIDLGGTFDLHSFRSRTVPAFPRLDSLTLRDTANKMASSGVFQKALEIDAILKKHAPKLQYISLIGGNRILNDAIETIVHKRKGTRIVYN
ncbi:hypothetical protein K470DRAFT_270549 [Piedraia hortae CBS 480.64]|uniref:F-box domain-containing protein n=1 Tax=Piedraia hortae CBS 480.64 TaxID=1314780 RepID=A0A6A7BZM4_9PEZI|nr:hypothetical protein K470DRAFT_270549 [Piedraia hortae CBS 480.64]